MYGALTNHPPTPQHTSPADVTKSQGEQSHSKSLVTIYIKSEDAESQWGEDAFPKSDSNWPCWGLNPGILSYPIPMAIITL